MIVGSEISKELRMMGHGEHNQSGIKTKYKHWTVIMIMMTMIDDDNGRWWWLFNHKNHFPGLVLDLALMMKRTQRRRFFSSHFPLFHIDIKNPYIITIIVFKIKTITRWMTTWLAQSTLAASTGWGQSTAKGSSSRSGTKKLRWLSLTKMMNLKNIRFAQEQDQFL